MADVTKLVTKCKCCGIEFRVEENVSNVDSVVFMGTIQGGAFLDREQVLELVNVLLPYTNSSLEEKDV